MIAMSESTQMVVVDGVRYRPEDAPAKKESKPESSEKQAKAPANKARQAPNDK